MVVHLYVFLILSNLAPPHPLPPSPADPLCRPANGGSACEDEGEENADRRAGRARNTSQRKNLTPWAEAGKTVILPFFSPFPHSPVRSVQEPSWAELSRDGTTNICEENSGWC